MILWILLACIFIVLILLRFHSINSMSNQSAVKARCHTEIQKTSSKNVQQNPYANLLSSDKLTSESKKINPYLPVTHMHQTKTLLNFQKPHSITLITKRPHNTLSQMKFSPCVQLTDPLLKDYTIDRMIGKGTHSTVYLGFANKTNKKVGIKKIISDVIKVTNKEISLLKRLNHSNVLKMIDHYQKIQNGRRILYVVSQLYDFDLFHYVRQKGRKLDEDLVKRYAYQVLKGLQYLHNQGIVHRDLKSSNILLKKKDQIAVIGDFGSAKIISFGTAVSGQPCPYSYKAPELLFGCNRYTFSSDVWAFGCILIEMATSRLPFKARNNVQQILQIINVLGTPTLQQLYEINQDYDERQYRMLPKIQRKNIKDVYQLDQLLINLLSKIFVYSPHRRITVSEALNHEYFNGIRIENSRSISDVSRFSNENQSFIISDKKIIDFNLKTAITLGDQNSSSRKNQSTITKSQINIHRNDMNMLLSIKKKLQF